MWCISCCDKENEIQSQVLAFSAPCSPGASELVGSTFSAPRSHPPRSMLGAPGRRDTSPTLSDSSELFCPDHTSLISCLFGGLRRCVSHWKSNMLLINRTTLANATWRNAGGGSEQSGTPTVWCAFAVFCAKGKTAEGADFSSLNWHSWCRCTHTHTHTHKRAHTLYGNQRARVC